MRLEMKIPVRAACGGLAAGFVNGLLGAGGGMLLLPSFSPELEQRRAHATSLLTMLTLSAVSALLYALDGRFDWEVLWKFLPGEVVGGVVGAFALNKMPPALLRRAFGAVAVLAGLRLLFR